MQRLPRIAARVAVVLAAAGAVWLAALQCWYLGWVIHYRDHAPQETAFMALRADAGTRIRYEWVDYEAISHWLKRSVIAAEDARFTGHNGFDWQALREAMAENLAAERIVRGGSTITQQLAKNLFLSPSQSIPRKLQEAAIAVMLETVLSKQRILELYLNVIEWGDGVFGAEQAARHYYGRSAARLGHWRAALLAARIPRPRYYDRNGVTDYLVERGSDIYGWAPQVRIP